MTDSLNPEPTNEQILAELDKLSNYGVIDYVLPTEPLGETWVVGIRGTIAKMNTMDEIVSFLAGVNAATLWAAKHVPGVAESIAGLNA